MSSNQNGPAARRGRSFKVPDKPIAELLALVDEVFGLSRILDAEGSAFVERYYRQSLPGYSHLYNRWQCMHVPLDGLNDGDSFFAQADAVAGYLAGRSDQRVLELGSGLGANTLHLARTFPEARFLGVDLMPEHVKRATDKADGLANVAFRIGDYADLPDDLGNFDVILGVETLCYARDPAALSQRLAAMLRPGGRVVIFDAHRRPDLSGLAPEVVTATRLYEVSTAVSHGFHPAGCWDTALEGAGLDLVECSDVTANTLRGLCDLHNRSLRAFVDPKWRLALRVMPRFLARNAVAGLLGYHCCFGAGAEPDPAAGAILYQKIVARKPLN